MSENIRNETKESIRKKMREKSAREWMTEMNERGVRGNGLEWARRECMDRERWRSVCRGHPLEGRFRRGRGVRAID